jgi:ribonuclease HI
MNRTIKKPKPAGVNTINCFTDGSRTGEISGCGFIIKGMNIHKQGFKNLGKYATVFQAEMFAIKDAADALIQRVVKNKKIEFFVDNQAAIKALGNYAVRSKLTEQCKRQLNVLATSNEVTVHWIPGHSGHTGNMVADNLAKMGTRKEVRTDIPISEAVIKQEIIKWSRKKHQELWDQGTDARQTRMLLPKVNGKLWAHLRRVPRDKLNLVTQIYTGHCTLQSHLYNMKISNNPHCEQCCEEDAEETVEHYLCECPAFSRNRYHTLGRLVLNPEDLKHLKLKNILDFIKNTKRFE